MTQYWVQIQWTEKQENIFGVTTDKWSDVYLLGNDLTTNTSLLYQGDPPKSLKDGTIVNGPPFEITWQTLRTNYWWYYLTVYEPTPDPHLPFKQVSFPAIVQEAIIGPYFYPVGTKPAPKTLYGPLASTTIHGNDTITGHLTPTSYRMNYYTYEWAIVDISAPPSTPSISVSDAPTVYETPLGTVAVFTVTLSSASQDTITVQYDTQDGSAHAQADYQAKTGTLTFMPGQPTTATISVPISKC